MENSKAQAAMEYLMSYGWAILVIVAILGSLAYLGIFNTSPPEICMMPAGMSCTKFYLSSATDLMNVTVANGLQGAIVVTNVSCTKDMMQYEGCQAGTTPGYPVCDGTASNVSVGRGEGIAFILKCNDENGQAINFMQGEAYSGKIQIEYYFRGEDSENRRRVSGNLYARAG